MANVRPSSIAVRGMLVVLTIGLSIPLAQSPLMAQTEAATAVEAAVAAARDQGSDVAIAIEEPQAAVPVSGRTTIRGWAADLRADGPGIDPGNLQVWLGGGEGNPLGFAQYGWRRDDIATLLGDERYLPTGFTLGWETCTFPAGNYNVTAFGWRRESADFGAAATNVTVRPCPQPAGSLLFHEALDGTNPSWPEGEVPGQRIGQYQEGAYHIQKLSTDPRDLCGVGDTDRTVYKDFALAVEGRVVEPAPTRVVSIAVRCNISQASAKTNDCYTVNLDPVLGNVSLNYIFNQEGRTSYIHIAEAQAEMHPGSAYNRVEVIADGSLLRVLVNGEQVLDARDERSSWGGILLGAGAPPGERSQAAYRDVNVFSR